MCGNKITYLLLRTCCVIRLLMGKAKLQNYTLTLF